MSRLKKTIASGAVAALSGTGAFMALGGHAAHASTPINGTSVVNMFSTWESSLGDIKYNCSTYAMMEMLQGDVTEAVEFLSSSEGNIDESCGYLAGYGVGVGYGFFIGG